MRVMFIVFLTILFLSLNAQDPQFTNFGLSPMLINPAFTGDGIVTNPNQKIDTERNMKLGLQHRAQWLATGNGNLNYNHTALYFDQINPLLTKWVCPAIEGPTINFSSGMYFVEERFLIDNRSPQLTNLKTGITGASDFLLNKSKKHLYYISVGVEGEMISKRLKSTNDLQFGTQFDGLGGFDPNISNREPFIQDKEYLPISFNPKWNFSTGIALGISEGRQISRLNECKFGLSVHHIVPQNLSLFDSKNDEFATIAPLWSVYTHFDFDIQRNENNQFIIRNRYLKQGKSNWQNNTTFEFEFIQKQATRISLGLGTRISEHDSMKLLKKVRLTDIYGLCNFTVNEKFNIGFSYEVNISPIAQAAKLEFLNTMELGLSYLFVKKI